MSAISHSNAPLRPLDIRTVQCSNLERPAFRLDAAFYRTDFAEAGMRAANSGFPVRKVSAMADAFVPGRVRLVTVPNPSAGAPYLRAHDAFEIRPSSERHVARARTRNYQDLLLKKGTILTPSSGRNLGPVAYVGEYLSKFAMTDIMRIVPKSEADGFYLLAYLMTPTAQALIRRGRSGTTVDHLSPEEVLNIDVPWITDDKLRESIIADSRRAEEMLDEGRRGLDAAIQKLHEEAGLAMAPSESKYLSRDCGDAFSLSSSALGLRLDAASHDPTVKLCSKMVKEKGGVELGQVARPVMLGRYVRYYVDAPHGRPILSGRQIMQVRPVNLRRISDRSFKDPQKFMLKAGTTIFTCDGRSEEALGEAGYVMDVWNGWMASNHVMRLEALPGTGHGFLYLAISSQWTQRQLKARASGSVVDALEPEEVTKVIIPYLEQTQRDALNEEAVRCWKLISDSIQIIEAVVGSFEELLSQKQC